MFRVGVVGGSGYTGGVAARLVATHPDLSLAFCTSDKLAGTALADHLMVPASGVFSPNDGALERADGCDAVILATSAEVSAKLAPAFMEKKRKVVDLSGAFRLARADYPKWYGFEHPAATWLDRAHYGLPELFGAPPDGALVSNPGCYPTASLLALGPLVRAGLVEPTGLIVDAKSGVTGAGRQAKEEYSFAEVDEDLRAYKLLTHQHTPEIARALSRFAPSSLTFSAHLLPIKRGILATCYARPRGGATPKAIADCLHDAYGKTAFVRVRAAKDVSIRAVAGTNHALIGVEANADVVIVVSAIDNLVKGAAGQAIQNLNLQLGLPEARGLESMQRISP